jgi:hypothetical protein
MGRAVVQGPVSCAFHDAIGSFVGFQTAFKTAATETKKQEKRRQIKHLPHCRKGGTAVAKESSAQTMSGQNVAIEEQQRHSRHTRVAASQTAFNLFLFGELQWLL